MNSPPPYADSEVGRLRTVLLHRPGLELSRLTPRNNDELLFDGIPWVGRAQDEHDAFAAQLVGHGVEVLYLADLLTDVMALPAARSAAVAAAIDDPRLGVTLAQVLAMYLQDLDADDLAGALMGGVRHDELPNARGLSHALMSSDDFILSPLPNLLFTRDSSVWVRGQVAVTSLAMPARNRETSLTRAIYEHHPRFASSPALYGPSLEHLEGGDVLLLAAGVVAVGVGERTTPAGAERLARR
ncbi:MAG: arginine deiminase, partial [Geodermatophilaceae bacterium]|nr:arginine deiminase [Geodermatophilaceae bacterium]